MINYDWKDVPSDEITHCVKCLKNGIKKRIWIKWPASTKEEKLLKGFKEKVTDLCANHYFGRIK